MKDLSNQDIIEALRLKAEEHERIAKNFRDAIQNLESIIKPEYDAQKSSTKMIRTKWPEGTSYESIIINILHDEIPRTAKELYQELKDRTKKDIYYPTFSGRLSQIIKDKGNIKIYKILTSPLSRRYFYGLKEWFIEDKLKDEYLNKIRKIYDEKPKMA
jgi:hypothetical protein